MYMRCISFVVSFAEIAIIGIDCFVCLMVRPAHLKTCVTAHWW